MRFLVRLSNDQRYAPKDARPLQEKIRTLLGSRDKIGNLRVSTSAIEFDLFVDQSDLERSKIELESAISKIMTLRAIDNRVSNRNEDEILREGVRLFNDERFWEAHEALEEIWHSAKGESRDVIQGLILTAAAFVHYQKNEASVCISILGRALEKLGPVNNFRNLDILGLRSEIIKMRNENVPRLVQIGSTTTKTTLQTS